MIVAVSTFCGASPGDRTQLLVAVWSHRFTEGYNEVWNMHTE